ncbi:hypothetical protein VTK26DRAFT_8208 [Humicola hyalothermophila]
MEAPQNDLDLGGYPELEGFDLLDYITNVDIPLLQFPASTETSPSSSNGTVLTPASGDYNPAFTGPVEAWDAPCLSSASLLKHSPEPEYHYAAHTWDTGLGQLPFRDTFAMTSAAAGDAAMTVQPALIAPQPASSTLEANVKMNEVIRVGRQRRRSSGLSAYQRRKRERPERCRECGKGHTHVADLNKHIASNHPEKAGQYGVSTERHLCVWCPVPRSFARRDHLLRHLTRRHGRVPNRRAGRSRRKLS